MTTEQLIQPRYKVIADYPNSIYKIGGILIEDRHYLFYNGVNHANFIHPAKFPHLFKKLEWWEDRDCEVMPEYLKDKEGEVWKVWEYLARFSSTVNLKKNFTDTERPYGNHSLYELLPATKEEYDQYTQNKSPELN